MEKTHNDWLTADYLELYTRSEEISLRALERAECEINLALRAGEAYVLRRWRDEGGMPDRDLAGSMLEVFDGVIYAVLLRHAKVGACDTEPRFHVCHALFNRVCDEIEIGARRRQGVFEFLFG